MADLYTSSKEALEALKNSIFNSIDWSGTVAPTACTCLIGETCTVVSEGACGDEEGCDCETACELSTQCTTACQKSCQDCDTCQNCEGGCSGNCQLSCQLTAQCTTPCERSCQSCQGGCSGDCQDTCELSCQSCNTACNTGCETSCQKCNSCQSQCEKGKQALTYHIGSVSITPSIRSKISASSYTSLAAYINKALDACQYTDSKLSESTTLKDVIIDDSLFDKIKEYVNKIASTTLSTGISEDSKIIVSNLSTVEGALNNSKIPNTIPCCEDTSYQNCVSRQKGCVVRLDA